MLFDQLQSCSLSSSRILPWQTFRNGIALHQQRHDCAISALQSIFSQHTYLKRISTVNGIYKTPGPEWYAQTYTRYDVFIFSYMYPHLTEGLTGASHKQRGSCQLEKNTNHRPKHRLFWRYDAMNLKQSESNDVESFDLQWYVYMHVCVHIFTHSAFSSF